MGDETNGGNANARAFGGVVAIVALVAGIAAIVRPQQQQIAAIERQVGAQLEAIRIAVDKHERLDAHPTALKTLAKFGERFTEVETQFRNLDERTGTHRRDIDRIWERVHEDEIRERTDAALIAALIERVKHLERRRQQEIPNGN